MTDKDKKNLKSPGQTLAMFLKDKEWTQEDLSYILSISLKHTNEIIKDKKPISLEIAKSLSELKVFNLTALEWMELGAKYQLENNPAENNSVRLKADIYEYMPINELMKKGWLKQEEDLEKELRRFWNIPKGKSLDLSFLDNCKAKLEYRTSPAFEETFNQNNALVWHQMALNFSKTIKSKSFEKAALLKLLDEMHVFTTMEQGIKKFLGELLSVGVRFVYLTHLSKTYLDGAAFMSTEGPVVALTGRYDRVDNFWFTLAHELSHVAFHLTINNSSIFIDDTTKKSTSQKEIEANENAEKILLQNEVLTFFEDNTNYITEDKVIQFSQLYSIHPSIVVGMLAHNELASYSTTHRFKEAVREQIPERYKADPQNLF